MPYSADDIYAEVRLNKSLEHDFLSVREAIESKSMFVDRGGKIIVNRMEEVVEIGDLIDWSFFEFWRMIFLYCHVWNLGKGILSYALNRYERNGK